MHRALNLRVGVQTGLGVFSHLVRREEEEEGEGEEERKEKEMRGGEYKLGSVEYVHLNVRSSAEVLRRGVHVYVYIMYASPIISRYQVHTNIHERRREKLEGERHSSEGDEGIPQTCPDRNLSPQHSLQFQRGRGLSGFEQSVFQTLKYRNSKMMREAWKWACSDFW